jgi:hypothetical protein
MATKKAPKDTTDSPLKNDVPQAERITDHDEIVRLRDTEQKSWAQVAQAIGVGSPGAARRLYTSLVRPHTESVLEGRRSTGAEVTPVHLADADLHTIRDAITGNTIVVQRTKDRTEDIHVARVTSLKDGTVNFNDGDKSRAVKAESIVATK